MNKHTENAVVVSNVSKSFKIPLDKFSGVKQHIVNLFNKKRGYREFTALKDISFEIKKGDFFGIVGRNGSGKSTLLKTIAQIYNADKGGVVVNGSLVPFIELGVGFNHELTGRENVFLNGALLGFSKEEMEAMYEEIVDFAELHDFMEEKLKNYSSGMQVRLAFSIAIRAESDILLLDEVLAVGDEAFQRKCNNYFSTLKGKQKTVILVTHSMDNVRKYCNQAMMVSGGEVVAIGDPEDIANRYSVENLEQPDPLLVAKESSDDLAKSVIQNMTVRLLSKKRIDQNDKLRVLVSYTSHSDDATKIRIALQDIDRGVPVYASSTKPINEKTVSKTFSLSLDPLNDINLKVQASIRNRDDDTLSYLADRESPVFAVRRTDYPDSKKRQNWAILFNRGKWS